MTRTPIETVTAFFRCWSDGIDALYGSLHEYFTPRTVWENVGLSRTVGPAEAEACFRLFEPMKTCLRMDVEMLAITAQGNKVLTERIASWARWKSKTAGSSPGATISTRCRSRHRPPHHRRRDGSRASLMTRR
jgi:limonene-1,2-epoxide hydrolase